MCYTGKSTPKAMQTIFHPGQGREQQAGQQRPMWLRMLAMLVRSNDQAKLIDAC